MNNFHFIKFGPSILGMLIISTLKAAIINVPGDYTSIQQAVNASVTGDTVLVDVGTYTENIRFNGKNITLASKYIISLDTSYITQTIIDGSNGIEGDTASCAAFLHGEDTTAVLQGFTLLNGKGTKVSNNGNILYEGGGIIIYDASPVIKNNIIKNNTALSGGGGISSFNNSSPRITNNIIMNNSAGYAGGIVLNWCGGYVRNNIVFNNSATGFYGTGGIMVWDNGSIPAYIENNTIIGNRAATTAGGLSTNRSGTPEVSYNLIRNNYQGSGNEIVLTIPTYYFNNNSYLNEGIDDNINVVPQFSGGQFQIANTEAGEDIGAHKGNGAMPFPDVPLSNLRTNNSLIFIQDISETKSIDLLITNNSSKEAIIDSIVFPENLSGLESIKEFSGDTISSLLTDTLPVTIQAAESLNLFDTLHIYHKLEGLSNPLSILFILDSDKNLQDDISGLQAQYTFNDITDNVISDELGISNGTCTSSTVNADGASGKCLGFNATGGTGSVSIPNTDSINFGQGQSFSVSLLYKGDPVNYQNEVFLLMKGATSGNWYAISTKNGQLRFTIDDDNAKTTCTYVVPDEFDTRIWHHIVAVRNCELDVLQLFIDGSLASSIPDNTEETIASTNPMALTNYSSTMNTGLDELQVFGKAMNEYEVADLFNTYTLTELSSVATLDTLYVVDNSFNEGGFTMGTADYSCLLPFGTTSANIEASPTSYWAKIQGTGNFSTIPGTASIIVTSEDGEASISYSIDFTVDETSATMIPSDENGMGIFPNPANDIATLNVSKNMLGKKVVIYNNLGHHITSLLIDKTEFELRVGEYPRGIYFIRTEDTYCKLIVQ